MPRVSSFAIDYNANDFTALATSSFDLIIVDGRALEAPPPIVLSDAEVAALGAQGRTVVGYVDVAVTDSARPYWNPAWTTTGDDLGPLTAEAPEWLLGQPTNAFGYLVQFWNAEWRQIVIDQAVDLVSRGYDGVFLDDVGAYFVLGQPGGVAEIALRAVQMIDLVEAVATAVRAIDPDAFVIVNGDPYLGTNANLNSVGSNTRLLAAIDAMLLENLGGDPDAIDWALANIAPGALLLDTRTTGFTNAEMVAQYQRGVIPYRPGDTNYDALGDFVGPGTARADTIVGGDGPNTLNGLAGDDVMSGGAGNDVLYGAAGADVLNGGGGADTMRGGIGDDAYVVNNASDRVIEAANAGVDLVRSSVTYALRGNLENLLLVGAAAADGTGNALNNIITGNAAANTLTGGGGDDVLNGGAGADILNGGAGADTFVFNTSPSAVDTIVGFNVAMDTIHLENALFGGAGPAGALNPARFHVGAAAADANDRIVYDSATGALYYDSDGTGAAVQVQFAALAPGLALSSGDFVVI